MPKGQGGLKRPIYYYYYLGCHLLNNRLVIDDFEADELGLKAGETDGWGYSANCLGGRRQAQGAGSWHIEAAEDGPRALSLSLPADSSWREAMPVLNASRFACLTFLLSIRRGSVDDLVVELRDAAGGRAPVPIAIYRADVPASHGRQ